MTLDDKMNAIVARMAREASEDRERRVKYMLGFWVSGLEPSICLNQAGEAIGLTAAGDTTGKIAIVLSDLPPMPNAPSRG